MASACHGAGRGCQSASRLLELGCTRRDGDDWTQTVAVLDDVGHYEAIAVVDRAFEECETVHFITRFPAGGTLVETSNSAKPARMRFPKRDFRMHPFTELVSVGESTVLVRGLEDQGDETFNADTVVLVTAPLPSTGLGEELLRITATRRKSMSSGTLAARDSSSRRSTMGIEAGCWHERVPNLQYEPYGSGSVSAER